MQRFSLSALTPWRSFLDEISVHASVWLVGGAVRDTLCGIQARDIDVATTTKATEIIRLAYKARIKIVWQHHTERYHNLRLWHPKANCHLDMSILGDANIEDDLKKRDLTINAMAIAWPIASHDGFIDPCGGRGDGAAHRLRLVPPAENALRRDPLRLLRLVRFLCLGSPWHLARGTSKWLTAEHVAAAACMPAERRCAEVRRALLSQAPWRLASWLGHLNAAAVIAPGPWHPPASAWTRARRGLVVSARYESSRWHWHLTVLLMGLVWPQGPSTRLASPWPLKEWLISLRLGRQICKEIDEASRAILSAPPSPTATQLAVWLGTISPSSWPLCCHLARVASAARWRHGRRLHAATLAAKKLLGRQQLPDRKDLAIAPRELLTEQICPSGPGLGALLDHLWHYAVVKGCWHDSDALWSEARRWQTASQP